MLHEYLKLFVQVDQFFRGLRSHEYFEKRGIIDSIIVVSQNFFKMKLLIFELNEVSWVVKVTQPQVKLALLF